MWWWEDNLKRKTAVFRFPYVAQKRRVLKVPYKELKAGVHLNAAFTPLKIGLIEMSRRWRFKQYKNPILKTQINVLECFVNFLVIFQYIWEEK